MSVLPVNEIFETVQGEAYFTGTPSIFIRLQGCAVGCPWCDTKHTWAMQGHREIPFDSMLMKMVDADTWANASVQELLAFVDTRKSKHVVITGGEPCDHDLTELTSELGSGGTRVQIETSGTRPVRVAYWTWVTVSPKLDMPGGFAVLPEALARADEIKMPVGKMADVEKLKALLPTIPLGQNGPPIVWLQPLSQSEKATALCVEQARENGWRISVQTHKYLGVR